MEFWSSFWNIIWFFIWAFVFIAYLMALFSIIADLFRDRELNGWWKAVWLITMVFIPFLTALVYLIFRGKGMAERNYKNAVDKTVATEDYIRSLAQVSPSDEIVKAKALLESGTITADEYENLKQRAMGRINATTADV
ncbi:PLD nuclease N-terminal domain-containing protein [Paeniglutamicibacter kerguelensis]|uniref:Membrane protein n=1 Tax=Paeniglutamicibacter kerguelensis TaxID=254788 RepID=A0ABS4XI36_9MICC|nr:putative membrane protein [Paeniglutamicibacter kerguelensis]